jgi:hypothetical protein
MRSVSSSLVSERSSKHMPRFEKREYNKPKYERRENPQPQEQIDEEDVKWNPTPEVFESFLKRDAELCAGNLRLALQARSPLSIKEMKDSTLHSSEVVDRQVAAWLADGTVQESKGKYALVAPQRGR